MNIPVLNFENVQEVQKLNLSVPALTLQTKGKFTNNAQKEAYRKKALQEIRRALKTSKDF